MTPRRRVFGGALALARPPQLTHRGRGTDRGGEEAPTFAGSCGTSLGTYSSDTEAGEPTEVDEKVPSCTVSFLLLLVKVCAVQLADLSSLRGDGNAGFAIMPSDAASGFVSFMLS